MERGSEYTVKMNAILVAILLIVGLTPLVAVRANTIEVTVSVTPNILWPPNHQYVTVETTVVVFDPSDPSPTITLTSTTSNEPDNDRSDGNTVNEVVVIDDFAFKLRAERSERGSGRIYTIAYTVTNMFGDYVEGFATVIVSLRI